MRPVAGIVPDLDFQTKSCSLSSSPCLLPSPLYAFSSSSAGCVSERSWLLLQCVVVERVGRRLLLIGGYSLMTCSGSVFTVALCLQVAQEEGSGWGSPQGKGWVGATGPHLTPPLVGHLPLDALPSRVLRLQFHSQLWHWPW